MNRLHQAFEGKSVFLTGHTGFKGTWLAHWLTEAGAEVHGYSLDPEPHQQPLFEGSGTPDRLAADHRADIRDFPTLEKALSSRPDYILHLAAQPLVRLSYEIPRETYEVNVMGTVNLLDAARGVEGECHCVVVTTDKCYRNREWGFSYREVDELGGIDPYSSSKACAELAAASMRDSVIHRDAPGLSVATARAGNVVGGGDWAPDRIVPDCFRALREGRTMEMRNPGATRPWQHVLEPLSGYLWLAACLGNPGFANETDNRSLQESFNFGPQLAGNCSVRELVEEIGQHATLPWKATEEERAPHEATLLNVSIEKAHKRLGWQPVWDFAHTIKTTCDWYLGEARGEDAGALCRRQIHEYVEAAAATGNRWSSTI